MNTNEQPTIVDEYLDLVSETNWTKGGLIALWMLRTGKSGEDFAMIVGGITGLHADRVARASSRFSGIKHQWKSLRWGHFHAAIDWPDATRWLAKANDKQWTVGQMRLARFENGGS